MAFVSPDISKRGSVRFHYALFKGAPIAVGGPGSRFGIIEMLDGRQHTRGSRIPMSYAPSRSSYVLGSVQNTPWLTSSVATTCSGGLVGYLMKNRSCALQTEEYLP